jgi:cobaltochelatase CobT
MTTPGGPRDRERVEELCVAAIRALSGEPDLHFRGGRLHDAHEPVLAEAPHLHPDPADDFRSHRGAADGLALRLLHSDADLHRMLAPEEPVARLVFEMLEQFRVESRVSPGLKGARHNLRHRHEAWSKAFHGSGLTETARGMLLYTVAQVCRSRVMGESVVEATEDLLEGPRFSLSPVIGHEIGALRRECDDQAGYAVPARRLAEKVSQLIREEDVDNGEDSIWSSRGGFSLWVSPVETDDPSTRDATEASGRLIEKNPAYRVFTRGYDHEAAVIDLVRRPQLMDYRRRLDERLQDHRISVFRIARALQELLTEPDSTGWDSAQEEGYIDGRRLSQLIASPDERRLFRTERTEPVSDSLVTFLVDCSGSMRRHQAAVALMVDVFVRALDLAGISSEVLGFTTRAWNGGRAMRDWRRSGRPARPGRLNELSHLIFKDADTSWRASRPALAAFLKDDLFREGIDGEAVSWAAGRMKARPQRRRLLIVVSDGSPMDSATNLVNDPAYLDHHLRDVVAREDAQGTVQIYGLGVGLDLSPYYSRRHALDLDGGLEHRVFSEVIQMLAMGIRR